MKRVGEGNRKSQRVAESRAHCSLRRFVSLSLREFNAADSGERCEEQCEFFFCRLSFATVIILIQLYLLIISHDMEFNRSLADRNGSCEGVYLNFIVISIGLKFGELLFLLYLLSRRLITRHCFKCK